MSTTKERMINLLPYYLQNGENINKYYKVLSYFYDELIDVLIKIIENRDIDLAEFSGLDIIGDIVGQQRNSIDDEIYRNRIKTRVIENNSRGYIEDLNQLGNIFLGDNFLGIRQGYSSKLLNNEPAMLEVNLSANKIEDTRIENNIMTLSCGTVELGTASLGCGIQAIPDKKIINKYKPIFIPNLELATAIGVRLQYRVKNNMDLIKIKKLPKLTFKSTLKNIKVKEAPNITVRSTTKKVKISSNINYSVQQCLQVGNIQLSAQLGVLL